MTSAYRATEMRCWQAKMGLTITLLQAGKGKGRKINTGKGQRENFARRNLGWDA